MSGGGWSYQAVQEHCTNRRSRVFKRRIERVIKRAKRRGERRFEQEQLRLWYTAEERIRLEDEMKTRSMYEDWNTYDANEQYKDDWDLDGEETYNNDYVYEDDFYRSEFSEMFGGGRRNRKDCPHCDTSNESDAVFCKGCGTKVSWQAERVAKSEASEPSEYGPWVKG